MCTFPIIDVRERYIVLGDLKLIRAFEGLCLQMHVSDFDLLKFL